MKEDRNLLDYIYVLVKWRRMIGLSVFLVVLATAGISLFLPEKWTANTMLLPHEEDAGNLEMSMLMSAAVPGNIGGLLGQSTPGERLVTILKSRRPICPSRTTNPRPVTPCRATTSRRPQIHPRNRYLLKYR